MSKVQSTVVACRLPEMSTARIMTYAVINGKHATLPGHSNQDKMFNELTATKWFLPLVCGLGGLALVNLGLTAWIFNTLQIGQRGLGSGNLHMIKNGINFKAQTEFIGGLVTQQLQATSSGQPLTIQTGPGNELHITDAEQMSGMHLSEGKLEVQTPRMTVKSLSEDVTLFEVTPELLSTATSGSLGVHTLGGQRIQDKLETSVVQGVTKEDLRLESRTNSVNVVAKEEIITESAAGEVSLRSFGDISINSNQVVFDTKKLELHGVPMSSGHRPRGEGGDGQQPLAFQLCSCGEQGSLFVATADGRCEADENCSAGGSQVN